MKALLETVKLIKEIFGEMFAVVGIATVALIALKFYAPLSYIPQWVLFNLSLIH